METLITLLGLVQKASGLEASAITPFYTPDCGSPAITYSFYSTVSDGAKSRYRFQVRVHAKTLEQAITLSEDIKKALVSLGDEPTSGLMIEANGGGSLLDEETNTPQQLIIYDILAKE